MSNGRDLFLRCHFSILVKQTLLIGILSFIAPLESIKS